MTVLAMLGKRLNLSEVLSWRGVLWVMLWLNIEADYGRLSNPQGVMGHLHAVRSVLAFAAAFGALLLLSQEANRQACASTGPVRLMFVYGVLALLASAFSVRPLGALYYGGLYVAVFIVLMAIVGGADPLGRSTQLLVLTWLIVAGLALVLIAVGHDALFGNPDWLTSDSEILHDVPSVAGVQMTRSTGFGRIMAAPAVVAFARLVCAKGVRRLLWGAAFCGFSAAVVATHGRTPILGLSGAVLLVLLVQRNKSWLFLALCVAALAVLADPSMSEVARGLLYRRGPEEDLTRLSGRVVTWQQGWDVFLRSPFLGLGPLADRFHMDWRHIHSTWLLALMQAGVVGTAFFVASWAVGWRLFFRNLRSFAALPERHQVHLVEAGAVLAFFTLRSIPETTAAAFSIDLLVIVPILAYLEILDRSLRQARVPQGAAQAWNGYGYRRPYPTIPQAEAERPGSAPRISVPGKPLTTRRGGVE